MEDDASTNGVSLDHVRKLIAAGKREAVELSGVLPKPAPLRDQVSGYEILGELGRGGMGVVCRAFQVSTKRTVALKVMLAGGFASASARTRFQREIELTARLQHPGIVRVFESGLTSGGLQYYAMDYVDAVPLDRWLMLSRPEARKVLATFIEVCEAVDHAHQHGVIHRDLKPGNVLVDAEGRPHILDFGLAKSSDHVESTSAAASVSLPGQIVGTLSHLSPEQAAGRPEEIDARTDVYALGVMLFEALTGAPPYDTTGHPSAVIQRILEDLPTRPSSLSDRVDGELETIVLKALEKERVRRYPTAREMSADLRRYVNGEPILARPSSSLYRLRKRLWRNRLSVGLILAGVVLAAAGVWGSLAWKDRTLEREVQRKAIMQDADVLVRRRQYDEAVRQYSQLLTAHPDRHTADIYSHRALAYLCLRQYEAAIEDHNIAVKVAGPAYPWHHYRRATPLWITNQLDKAAADYRSFLELNRSPSYATARLFLVLQDQARLLEAEGREIEARSAHAEADRRMEGFLSRVDIRGSWLEEICLCLAGKLNPQELIDRATKRPSTKVQCEAYYYAGEVCRLKSSETRDTDQAREWSGKAMSYFEQCVGTDLMIDRESGVLDPMNEYYLAKWRLETLAAARPSSAPSTGE